MPNKKRLPLSYPPQKIQRIEQGAAHLLRSVGFFLKTLPELTHEQAHALIDGLYAPGERFAEGFYKFRRQVLKQSEEKARQATAEECRHHADRFKDNLHDPNVFVLTTGQPEEEVPVGIYCLRPIENHQRGKGVLEALKRMEMTAEYNGEKGIVHSFSLFQAYRDLQMLKFVFVSIAAEALRRDYAHLFFFMSDQRLKSVYKRYGLKFPLDLIFADSQHSIGCYSLSPEEVERIEHFISGQSALMEQVTPHCATPA